MKVTGLDKILEKVQNLGTPGGFRAAVLATYGEAVQRIFTEGIAADGNKIGSYSTDPIYVNPENSPRKFTPKGKDGKSAFANGNPKKTRYFAGGYSAFRAAAGRQNQTVDLVLTGKLRSDFVLNTSQLPYSAEFTNNKSAEIAAGNEERFGKIIFEHTDQEIENLVRRTLEFSKTN